MNLHLSFSENNQNSIIQISGSKSETNRLLLLQNLHPNLQLLNTSNSDDSNAMTYALSTSDTIINIHHAGTAMRFLTAHFASQPNKIITLTGSARMKQRPIQILVDALKQLGARIEYLENDGFPPLKIYGKSLTQNQVQLPADVSSQYISALLLIASKLPNGIQILLVGQITSIPYIQMTLALLNKIGVETSFLDNLIVVKPTTNYQLPKTLNIESDWSSASYYYSIVAMSKLGTTITLFNFKPNSLQGDSKLTQIYEQFGVTTTYKNNTITITKIQNLTTNSHQPPTINLDLNTCPDIAQTIAVTCFGLGLSCHLTGLHTLKIKETDRLQALQIELGKLGATISVTDNSLTLLANSTIRDNISIATYQDHRMAMAFAPLALKTNISIQNAEVVSKSYPNFWKDLQSLGIQSVEY